MQVEDVQQDSETTIYTRVGPAQIINALGQYVSVVGKVTQVGNNRVTLDIGGQKPLSVVNCDFDGEQQVVHLEVRGQILNNGSLKCESWNIFGDASFDLETFNKMLDYYHNPEYASLTLG